MSGFSQFLGAIAGQVASRVILNKVANVGLSQTREPAREPGGYQLPVIVPKGAEFDRLEAGVPSSRYKIPNWLFFTGYGALLWYAAKATAPVDLPDLGDPGPEEALLFPGLKRELTQLDVEDISTSDDPVEACLERAGWKLPRIDELRQSIFEKEQVDLFTTPEPLTRSEGELLEAIETCMQKLEIQYGSLEAAGVVCSDCGDDGDAETLSGPFTFDGKGCRDAQGNFVPIARCKGKVARDPKTGRYIPVSQLPKEKAPEDITAKEAEAERSIKLRETWEMTREEAESEQSQLNKKAIEIVKARGDEGPKKGTTLPHDEAKRVLAKPDSDRYKQLAYLAHKWDIVQAMKDGKPVKGAVLESFALDTDEALQEAYEQLDAMYADSWPVTMKQKKKKIKRNSAIEAEVRQNDRLPLDSAFRNKLYKAYQKFIGTKDEEKFLESVIKNISGNPRVEKTQDGYTNGLWTVTRSGLRKGDIFEKWEDIPKDIVEYLASHPELVEYWEKQLE